MQDPPTPSIMNCYYHEIALTTYHVIEDIHVLLLHILASRDKHTKTPSKYVYIYIG